jgi:hypothetical protein
MSPNLKTQEKSQKTDYLFTKLNMGIKHFLVDS